MSGFSGTGHFGVDEGAADCWVAVRWYSVPEDEMEENSCNIEAVTEYDLHEMNMFPSAETTTAVLYRGHTICINSRYSIYHNDTLVACVDGALENALSWVDERIGVGVRC